jgi:Family of unknown function (DUF6236)
MSETSKHLIGLYYPSIHFRDDSWIKIAALYWDKIGRIVPPNYPLEDSDVVKQLIEETDFIRNLPPSATELENTAHMFLEVIRKHGRLLKRRYSLAQDNIPSYDSQIDILSNIAQKMLYTNLPSGKLRDADLELLVNSIASTQKMTPELTLTLLRKGFARNVEVRDELRNFGFIEMHPRLALTYMEVLAEQMAVTRKLHPVTDNPTNHQAISRYTIERLTNALLSASYVTNDETTDQTIKVYLADITIRSILPQDPENVPIYKIAQLRERYRPELTNFQQELQNFTAKLSYIREIKDPDTLNLFLTTEFEKNLKPQIDDLSKCLRSISINTTMGALSTQVIQPQLSTSLDSLVEIPSNPIIRGIGAAGSVIFSLIPVLRKHKKLTEDLLKSSPAAYLLHIEQDLAPSKLHRMISRFPYQRYKKG